jgi:hypothetical protein
MKDFVALDVRQFDDCDVPTNVPTFVFLLLRISLTAKTAVIETDSSHATHINMN